ncbi:MAG: hypothetical protein ACXADD_18570, partial [Candidatus Thorarchaeota archaeon]
MSSMMQVVGSSRISNTVYLAVASLYWTVALEWLGVSIDFLTDPVTTALVIIPVASGIGVVLWAWEPEKQFFYWLFPKYLPYTTQGLRIRGHMGKVVLLLRRWRSSTVLTDPLLTEMRKEVRRVLESLELKEDMERLFQLFWVFLAVFPFFYLVGSSSVVIREYYIVIGLVACTIVAAPIYRAKSRRPRQVLQYSLALWIIEAIVADERKRSGLDHELFLKRGGGELKQTLLNVAKDGITLLARKDWVGFEKLASQQVEFIEGFIPSVLTDEYLNDFVQDTIWSILKIHQFRDSFKETHANILHLNIRRQFINAFEEIRSSFLQVCGRLAKVRYALKGIGDLVPSILSANVRAFLEDYFWKESGTHPNIPMWPYLNLNKEILERFSRSTFHRLRELPHKWVGKGTAHSEFPEAESPEHFMVRLAEYLVKDADSG